MVSVYTDLDLEECSEMSVVRGKWKEHSGTLHRHKPGLAGLRAGRRIHTQRGNKEGWRKSGSVSRKYQHMCMYREGRTRAYITSDRLPGDVGIPTGAGMRTGTGSAARTGNSSTCPGARNCAELTWLRAGLGHFPAHAHTELPVGCPLQRNCASRRFAQSPVTIDIITTYTEAACCCCGSGLLPRAVSAWHRNL